MLALRSDEKRADATRAMLAALPEDERTEIEAKRKADSDAYQAEQERKRQEHDEAKLYTVNAASKAGGSRRRRQRTRWFHPLTPSTGVPFGCSAPSARGSSTSRAAAATPIGKTEPELAAARSTALPFQMWTNWPALATLELSVRALDPQVRLLLEQRIKALVAAQAESFGVRAEVAWRQGYCVLVNHLEQTNFARQVALNLVGPERVTLNGPQLTGSEDFAFMLEKVPGSYLLIGNGDGDSAGACMVHNPAYDFNDDNIATGASYWVALVQAYLAV